MVQVIPATPAAENTLLHVVVGSFSVVGLLVGLALMLGVAVAGFRVIWHKRHPPTEDHLPPVV
jgi:hypothetical protein